MFFDDNAPTFCAGTRKLVTAYAGQCLNVNVVGVPTDFGFSGLNFDKAAMETAVGAGEGEVLITYDQSGNARDMVGLGAGKLRASSVTYLIGTRTAIKAATGKIVGHAVTTIGDLITNSAGTILWVGVPDTIATNDADPSANDQAWKDNFGILGVGFKSTGVAQAWNDDNTTWDIAANNVTLATPLAIAWRHSGGNIQINVNGGGWTSATSGNTRAVTGSMEWGSIGGTFRHAELATLNTAVSDANVEIWGAEVAAYWGFTWGAATAQDPFGLSLPVGRPVGVRLYDSERYRNRRR